MSNAIHGTFTGGSRLPPWWVHFVPAPVLVIWCSKFRGDPTEDEVVRRRAANDIEYSVSPEIFPCCVTCTKVGPEWPT